MPAKATHFSVLSRVQTGSGASSVGARVYTGVPQKLTTHLHPELQLRMRGAIPPQYIYLHGVMLISAEGQI
jgi:hypothetical protein